jgi:hypothetical protein
LVRFFHGVAPLSKLDTAAGAVLGLRMLTKRAVALRTSVAPVCQYRSANASG